jgi:Tfp pilus assembly protein PilO
VTLSDRDKKIVIAIVPLLLIAAYWFLLLSPKREEAAKAAQEQTTQEQRRDAAQTAVDQASRAETDFAADYSEIVRLGKAIPAQVDMPSLLVQLDSAAEGTGIHFTKIKTGERAAAPFPVEAASSESAPPAAADGGPPVAAGGEQAQSAPGGAAEAANTAAGASDQRSAAAEQSGVNPADTQTATSSGSGLPVGGGATGSAPAGSGSPTGLETVPLELEFVGDFFNLADFFHDVKRFVRVAGKDVVVGGRLITIETVNYSSDPAFFPMTKAELKATIYLAPETQGTTAGATPQGPQDTPPASTPAAADGAAPAPAPTAVATP